MKFAIASLGLVLTLALTGCSDKKPPAAKVDVTAPYALAAATLPPHVVALSGFSHAEDWGRWTDGPTARIDFAAPLPAKFTLDLNVKFVYGGNSAKPTQIKVGNATVSPLFNESGKRYTVAVTTDGNARAIEFVIPEPLSPADADKNPNGDKRKLGLGLADIKITPN
jgi:hypothetical protein